jgi:hypothetical protein
MSEIIEYNLDEINTKQKIKKTRKKKNIEDEPKEVIEKRLNDLTTKINKLQELENARELRINNNRAAREEKKKAKELAKEEKLKLAEESKKQAIIDRDNRIKELIEESSKNFIKSKINNLDNAKDDVLKFHVNRHNNLRRLNLNF